MAYWNYGEVRLANDIRHVEGSTMKQLCEDLFYLSEGKNPTRSELRSVPTVTKWTPIVVNSPALVGFVKGAKRPEDNGWQYITDIAVSGADFGWIRTHDSYFKLGKAAHPEWQKGWHIS